MLSNLAYRLHYQHQNTPMLTQVPVFDFATLIDKHMNAPFRRERDWEIFYADTANDVYNTFEYLSRLNRKITAATAEEKAAALSYVTALEPQVSKFMDLMCDAGFESHYYDRLWHELCNMQDDIASIKKKVAIL